MVQKLGPAEGLNGPRKWPRALEWDNVASSTLPGGKGLTLIIKKKKKTTFLGSLSATFHFLH